MAIIKCSECGHDVSEYAAKCPNCGCPINVIKVKNNQINEEKLKNINKKDTDEEDFQTACNIIEIPKNKPHINWFLIIGIAMILFWGIVLITFDSDEKFIDLLMIVIGIILILVGHSSLKESQRMYDEYKDNPEEYRRVLAMKTYHNIKSEENARERAKERKQSKAYTVNQVKCPYCNSMNTKKLSVTNKAGSVAMFGLMSNKVGKQWHCNSCGSDF